MFSGVSNNEMTVNLTECDDNNNEKSGGEADCPAEVEEEVIDVVNISDDEDEPG